MIVEGLRDLLEEGGLRRHAETIPTSVGRVLASQGLSSTGFTAQLE
jgi:hypothetical protein